MSTEAIIARIGADAEGEAAAILAEAQARAEEIISAAEEKAAADRAETEAELKALTARMAEVNAAAARLDSAKIRLEEKRRVIETIYARALGQLNALGERESLRLLERLLRENADVGDEIVFDENYPYGEGAKSLSVVRELGLRVSEERIKIGGGCLLRGEKRDKDISYPALLAADMEENQSALAERLFK